MPVIVSPLPPLLEAMEENLHGHVAYVQRRTPVMQVDDRADLLLVESGLPCDSFNKILRARLTEADADRRIAEAVGYFRAVNRPFAWWVGPGSRPLDLERRLEEHGLRAAESELGMALELAQLPAQVDAPAGLEVRRVLTPADLDGFLQVAASEPSDPAVAAFFQSAAPLLLEEDCPMRLFAGYLEGTPAAISELFVGGGVAGIHAVATRAEFRGQGIGSLMTWTAAAEGRRLGLPVATLQASEQGQGVYARLGFHACCRFVEYQ
ncbi:MAG: GNAT family N-acetyltransferase [Acidobacteria bacterium]|nr:GNAT family N-acetyltransferase [Acidobacteriota bacterium]